MTPTLDLGSEDLTTVLDLFGETGCKGRVACIKACGLDGNCIDKCFQNTTPSGNVRYSAAADCLQHYCVGVNHCAWTDAQMTMVMPVPGDGASVCDDCLHDAGSTLFGEACRHPGSADCTQTQCSQPIMACLNDLP